MPDDLTERLDAATEPHYELDQSIAHAVGQDPRWEVPEYTASLDAALTPAGDQWLMALQKAILGLKPYMAHPPREWPTRAARSEALRKRFILDVCAEALKARAAEEKSDA